MQIGFETGLAGWRPIGAARIQRDPLAREGRWAARFNGTGVADQGMALPAVLRCKPGKSYDHRTHWSGPDPPAVAADPGHRQVVVPNWQIPLRVGQRTALIQGDIVWVPGPSPWPWRLLAAAAFALMVLAGWRSWYSLLAVLVVVAVTADAFHTIGALMASPAPLPTKLYASVISVVAWAAALAALWQLRRRRLQAGRILLLVAGTLLAFASAVSDARTLASSQLVASLDPALTRTGIALTFGLGLGMVAASLVNRRTARPTTTPRQAVAEPGAWPTGLSPQRWSGVLRKLRCTPAGSWSRCWWAEWRARLQEAELGVYRRRLRPAELGRRLPGETRPGSGC